MLLGILGLAIIIVGSVHAYRTAKENGRNAAGWTLAVIGIGIGLQFIIPFIIGFIIAIVMFSRGSSVEEIQESAALPAVIINVVCLILSVPAILLVLNFLARVPEETPFAPPPSPPEF
ncbi:MAG: hypothetical protein R2747_22950 [Pyrinomonadaceae bacterium]